MNRGDTERNRIGISLQAMRLGKWILSALYSGMIIFGAVALLLAWFIFLVFVLNWPSASWFRDLLILVVAIAGAALVCLGAYRLLPGSQAQFKLGGDARAVAQDGHKLSRAPRPFLLLWLYYGTGHFVTVSVFSLGVFILPGWVFVVLAPLPHLFFQFIMFHWGPLQTQWPPIAHALYSPESQWLLLLINSALYGALLAWLHVALRK